MHEPFSKQQILDSSKSKEFADDNFKVIKMMVSSAKGWKTLWEKEKLLVTSNLSFSHCVFKRFVRSISPFPSGCVCVCVCMYVCVCVCVLQNEGLLRVRIKPPFATVLSYLYDVIHAFVGDFNPIPNNKISD